MPLARTFAVREILLRSDCPRPPAVYSLLIGARTAPAHQPPDDVEVEASGVSARYPLAGGVENSAFAPLVTAA